VAWKIPKVSWWVMDLCIKWVLWKCIQEHCKLKVSSFVMLVPPRWCKQIKAKYTETQHTDGVSGFDVYRRQHLHALGHASTFTLTTFPDITIVLNDS
jgi:hypothetical protein